MATSSPLYRNLCPSKEEIRLLELHPSDALASDITASLSVVSLRDNPSYVALSYTWGGYSIPIRTISLSGHTKTVTDNLRAALYALRDKTETRLIWIDALCIDQEDNTEKDHQIKLMRKIYRKCASCWIWLGGATSIAGIEAAVQLLENWARDEHLNANVNFDSTLIKTVTELTTRAWFSRIWTVQE
ncbi:HET-domain-containing protein, partial [Hyaloscypha variabilis F]